MGSGPVWCWRTKPGSGGCSRGPALAGAGVLPHSASCLGDERPPALPILCLAVFSGPPDPLHGNSLNQKVRVAAQVSTGPLPHVPGRLFGLCLPASTSEPSRDAQCSPALCPHPHLSWQDLASVLFSDAPLPQPATLPARPLPPTGKCRPLTALSPPMGCAGMVPSAGDVGVQRVCWPGGLLGVRAGCHRPQ